MINTRIVFDPKFFPEPFVEGPATPVASILAAIASGMSLAELLRRTLGLYPSGIACALDFAGDVLHAQYGPRRVHGWGKVHASSDTYQHGIVAFDAGGSVLTACNGRWSASSEAWTYAPNVTRNISPKCAACLRVATEQITKESK